MSLAKLLVFAAWVAAACASPCGVECGAAPVSRAGVDAASPNSRVAPTRAADPPSLHASVGSAPTLSARDNPKAPVGGLSITQPPQTADAPFYKIGAHQTITFGWQYTSLSATPQRLFVVASCSQNGNTYPIAPSPTGIPGTQTNVTWDAFEYGLQAHKQGNPDLVQGKYRLLIYDERGPSAAPKGGEFSPNNNAEFALYYPKPYTPLARTLRRSRACSPQNGRAARATLVRRCRQ